MAIEAITYDRAYAYRKEFPEKEYMTWQPKQVFDVMLEIDQAAGADATISIGPSDGDTMFILGVDKVLDQRTIRKHYDALGSYLHIPTVAQQNSAKPVDFVKLRARCIALSSKLNEILSSTVSNAILSKSSSIDCQQCGTRLWKRSPDPGSVSEARCIRNGCSATYAVELVADGQVRWTPKRHSIPCQNGGCAELVVFWQSALIEGKFWVCEECGQTNTLALCVIGETPPD